MDAPIVLLFVVGSYEISLISRFKRTSIYTSDDFELLGLLFSYFRRILVTPHVLAEVNSLLSQLSGTDLDGCRQKLLELIAGVEERFVTSSDAGAGEAFPRFGLTDSTLCRLSLDHAVLTDDWPLYGFLESREADVIKFTHLRNLLG